MSHKSSGLWCDLCGKPILSDEWWHIRVNGKEGHSCEACKIKYEAEAPKATMKVRVRMKTRDELAKEHAETFPGDVNLNPMHSFKVGWDARDEEVHWLREALKVNQRIVIDWRYGAIGYDKHGRAAMDEAIDMADQALALKSTDAEKK